MQVPGHKMRYAEDAPGWAADLVGDTVGSDVPLQGGVDDNAFTNKYLEQAETLWAAAVGADHSRFLLGGSSQGNIAALGTVAQSSSAPGAASPPQSAGETRRSSARRTTASSPPRALRGSAPWSSRRGSAV